MSTGQDALPEVRCRSTHRHAVRPEAFTYIGEAVTVRAVVREWKEPSRRVFEVVGENERFYRLCYNEVTDLWSAVEFVRKG